MDPRPGRRPSTRASGTGRSWRRPRRRRPRRLLGARASRSTRSSCSPRASRCPSPSPRPGTWPSWGALAQVQPSQPPVSLTTSASTISPAVSQHPSRWAALFFLPWRRGEVNVLSPEQQHSPSTVLAFSDSSCSPDKENQPPLGGAKRCSSRVTAGGSVVWEDPGSSSARSPGAPGHHETHET